MKYISYIELSETESIRLLAKGKNKPMQPMRVSMEELTWEMKTGQVRLAWIEGGPETGLPHLIIAKSSTLASLIGKIISLPTGISPFTSVIRAWDIDDLKQLPLRRDPMPSLLISGFVGLIIGELHRAIGKTLDLRRVGLDMAQRTLAHTCFQAATLGYPASTSTSITERWLEISHLTGHERSQNTAVAVSRLSEFITHVSSDFLKEISPQNFSSAIDSWINFKNDHFHMNLIRFSNFTDTASLIVDNPSREARFSLVEEAISSLDGNSEENFIKKGFLISLIDPGSFDFLEYCSTHDDQDGAVTLAYAMCTGLLGGDATLGKFRGFGLNIHSNNNISEIHFKGDISISEIRILNNSSRDAPIEFRTRSSSVIDVELAPGVYGSFANSIRRKQSKQLEQQPDSDSSFLRERIAIARHALETAYRALEESPDFQDKKSNRARPKRSF